MINVNFENGANLELPDEGTGVMLAKKLKKDLNGSPLAIKINGELKDLSKKLEDGSTVSILTFSDKEGKEIFWHSAAHLLAQAVLRLYPDAKPTIGPAIDDGFYYDFYNLSISENDFSDIELEVKKIVRERATPKRIEYINQKEAIEQFRDNPFKVEMIEKLDEGLSAYQQGEFIDLCRGPHIPHINLIQAFKILKTSGAYWRGNQDNEQLTRIYAIAFPEKKMLSKHLSFLSEAKKRDHRVIGKQQGLFSFHEEAAGMPFIHPKGNLIWDELMRFWDEKHSINKYLKIKTPLMMAKELWVKSGHWDNYKENMYMSHIDDKDYAIKPMNCPGCMMYYKSGHYSYKQLPLRIAEIGNVHRHELSGALSGLFRVRSFHQDDAHIFMKPSDIKDEILGVLTLAGEIYAQFGLTFHLELSTRPEKSIGSDEQWSIAENGLREAMEGRYDFTLNEGDGAFYGPKIDIHINDAIGRSWQCGTIQLDMSLPERFDLFFNASDGTKKRPIMIHRVIYGSIERFLGIIVEHYAGRFPLWLSPIQVRILPISDKHNVFARKIKDHIENSKFRVDIDASVESINKKVRNAQIDQVNYVIVIGNKELDNDNISIRTRSGKIIGSVSIDEFIDKITKEYSSRSEGSIYE